MAKRRTKQCTIATTMAFLLIAGCAPLPSQQSATIPEAPATTQQYKAQMLERAEAPFDLDEAILKHREFAKKDPKHVIGITDDEEKVLRKMKPEDAKGVLSLKAVSEEMTPIAPPPATGSRRVQADAGYNWIDPKSLQAGDHLIMLRYIGWNMAVFYAGIFGVYIWHHAIVVTPDPVGGNPNCINYPTPDLPTAYATYNDLWWTNRYQNPWNAPESYNAIYRLNSPLNVAPWEAVARAEAKHNLSAGDGSEVYKWDTNNCEHLVRWCREKRSYSSQWPLYQDGNWSKPFNELKIIYRTAHTQNWVHLYSDNRDEYSNILNYSLEREEFHLKRGPANGLVPLWRKEYWENGHA